MSSVQLSLRQRPHLAAMIALSLVASSCGFLDRSDDDAVGATTTEVADPDDQDQGGDPSTTTSTVTETTAPDPVDLSDVAWVINDFDGLVDDRGRALAETGSSAGAARPSVVRSGDGSIYYVLDGELWRQSLDESAPERIDTEASEVSGVAYDADGAVIINPFDDAELIVEGNGRIHADGAELNPDEDFITAPNGITVRVLPPDADVDELGYVTEFRSPARLEVERDGEVDWTMPAGGVAAPWLNLVDFDGRFVMMARYPTEPADPMMQHVVYDLRCPGPSPGGDACTRSFWARWGTASLVGPDLPVGDNDLNPQLLDLCPTMRIEIAPPAEMTDPEVFNATFGADDIDAFRLAAFQLATCDPLGLGDPEQQGLVYRSGDDADQATDGWMWTDFARAMRGPFVEDPDGTWVWARHPTGARAVLTSEFGDSHMTLMTGRQVPGDVAVTVAADAVVATGNAAPDVAAAVIAAAEQVAGDLGVEPTIWVEERGQAHDDDLVDEFVTAIEALTAEGTIGEVHLTTGEVISRAYESAVASDAEQALGFAVADLASGGEGVFPELPLADEVAFALGSEVVAVRDSSILFRRSAWTVNASLFRASDGPFNILDNVPSPSNIVVGPHRRCAGPLPLASPPELAGYRRIGILPADDSIGSCLEWSAVDMFVDAKGVIHGFSLDRWEP